MKRYISYTLHISILYFSFFFLTDRSSLSLQILSIFASLSLLPCCFLSLLHSLMPSLLTPPRYIILSSVSLCNTCLQFLLILFLVCFLGHSASSEIISLGGYISQSVLPQRSFISVFVYSLLLLLGTSSHMKMLSLSRICRS